MLTQEELLKQARLYNDEKKFNDTTSLLTTNSIDDFKNADLFKERAFAWYQQQDYDKAITDYTTAIAIKPEANAYFNRGMAFHNKAHYNKAIEDYTRTIKLDGSNWLVFYNRGLAFYNNKEYAKAIEDYNKVLELNANDYITYNDRGNAFYALRQYDTALSDYLKTIELKPDADYAFRNAGLVYSYKKDYEHALEYFNKASELNPKYTEVYNDIGNVYLNKKDYDKAKENYQKSIELNPSADYAYRNMGLTCNYKKEYESAIENFTKAVELNPQFHEAYNDRGNAWLELKDNEKAISDYSKAIEINPDFVIAYRNRGLAYYSAKDYDKALADLDKAIMLDAAYADAYNDRANAWLAKKEYDKAIEDYTAAITLKQDADFYYNRGIAWRDKLELDKAVKDFEKVIEFSPEDKEAKSLLDETDTSVYFLNEVLKDIENDTERDIIKKAVIPVYDTVQKIRQFTKNIEDVTVAHYSKLKVADILVSGNPSTGTGTYLRYYNAVYMNDPDEGKILFKCLNDVNDTSIERSFLAGKQEEDNNVYLGSFLISKHQDDLVMWRTYGKDEKSVEAAGCSFVIKTTFFDADSGFLQPQIRKPTKTSSSSISVDIDTGNQPSIIRSQPDIPNNTAKTSKSEMTSADYGKISGQSLNKVLYFDNEKKIVVGDNGPEITTAINDLKNSLLRLIFLKSKDETDIKNITVNRIIFRLLSELRYLFKSSDYSFENELRVIQYVEPKNEKVSIDDNGGAFLPKRLYINSNKPVQPFIEKIILGPKVPSPAQWMYLDVAMKKKGYSIELKSSVVRFQ